MPASFLQCGNGKRTLKNDSHQAMCPACAHSCSESTEVLFTQGLRGKKLWRRCYACKSFFDPDRYGAQEEVLHTVKTAWGRMDSGIELNAFKTKMYRFVLHLLEKYCPPHATLLDTGCGYGGFLIQARKRGYDVFGLDILPQAVEYVRSLGIPAQQGFSIDDVKNVADGSLHLLSCLDCNYYWPNQPLELQNAFTKLRPGGYLIMRVVDKSWLFACGLGIHKLVPNIGEKILARSVNDHRFSMPVRSLLHVIRNCGFRIVYASPRGACHSTSSRWTVRLSFALATLLWETTGKFVAPGAVILARKPVI
jgi:SAM-dependent methyltransferase